MSGLRWFLEHLCPPATFLLACICGFCFPSHGGRAKIHQLCFLGGSEANGLWPLKFDRKNRWFHGSCKSYPQPLHWLQPARSFASCFDSSKSMVYPFSSCRHAIFHAMCSNVRLCMWDLGVSEVHHYRTIIFIRCGLTPRVISIELIASKVQSVKKKPPRCQDPRMKAWI